MFSTARLEHLGARLVRESAPSQRSLCVCDKSFTEQVQNTHQYCLHMVYKGAGVIMRILNPFLKKQKQTLAGQDRLQVCCLGARAIISNLVFYERRVPHLGLVKMPLSPTAQVEVLCNLGGFHDIFLLC